MDRDKIIEVLVKVEDALKDYGFTDENLLDDLNDVIDEVYDMLGEL